MRTWGASETTECQKYACLLLVFAPHLPLTVPLREVDEEVLLSSDGSWRMEARASAYYAL